MHCDLHAVLPYTYFRDYCIAIGSCVQCKRNLGSTSVFNAEEGNKTSIFLDYSHLDVSPSPLLCLQHIME